MEIAIKTIDKSLYEYYSERKDVPLWKRTHSMDRRVLIV